MDNNIKTEQLLADFVNKKLSKKDIQVLKTWSEKSPENKKLFDLLSMDEETKENLKNLDHLKSPIYWNAMKARMKRAKRIAVYRKLSRYAAAVLLPVSIALAVYFITVPKIQQEVATPVQIKPGIKNATILFAENTIIELDTVDAGIIRESSTSAIVKESSGKLIYQENTLQKDGVEAVAQKIEYHTLSVARGEEFYLELSDGSKIWLNSDSRIKYPVPFKANVREVFLEKGEAYFEIAYNPDKRFVLTSEKSVISVLGTSFNVSAYEGEDENITLVEGSVDLRPRYDPEEISKVRLNPGDQANVIDVNHKIRISKVNTEFYTSWKDGVFFFNYETLESIMTKLSRWYNFEISYASESVRSEVFFGKLKRYDTIENVLDLIRETNKVDFEIEGNVIIVKDIEPIN